MEIYAELAQILIKNLFGEMLILPAGSSKASLLGRFLEEWNRLDRSLVDIATRNSHQRQPRPLFDATRFLHDTGVLEPEEYFEINELRKLRNAIVHNEEDYKEVLNEKIVNRVKALADLYDELNSGT